MTKRQQLNTEQWVEGVLAGDRAILARAITLVESRHPSHRAQAQEVMQAVLPHTGKAKRIGLSGVPGVGKSTFIEAVGLKLCDAGHKVAVLAVDPSSQCHGGSILGDKTRMSNLSMHENAFIRPSPSGGTLGGVAAKTRETLLLMEAAGHDIVLVETVGVGQSETMVADMTDFYLVLMLPGAGDDLQGIKKGVLEIADMVVVNKADGDTAVRARHAVRDYQGALHMLTLQNPEWPVPVLSCSAIEGHGLDQLWNKVDEFFDKLGPMGCIQERRQRQQLHWMWSMVETGLKNILSEQAGDLLKQTEQAVLKDELTANAAATRLLDTLRPKQ